MTGPALPNAPRTRAEQFAFLRAAHDGPLTWKAMCLSLARQAPGLPAVYPSALSAAHATPESHRVHNVADLRRGMVAFYDDPNDGNPYAHIVTVAGFQGDGRDLSDLFVWSNDAKRTGGVDLVRGDFFPREWGDGFLFGATCLNGYDLPGYDDDTAVPTPQAGRGKIGPNLDHAIIDVQRAIRRHRAKGHAAIVRALSEDLAALRETRARFPR